MSSLRKWGRDDLEFSEDAPEYHCPRCKRPYGLRLIFGHYKPGEDRFSAVYVRCHKMFCDDCEWFGHIADLLVPQTSE